MNIKLSDHFSYKKLAVFCMPPVFMMIFTSIYGVVDGFFISNFVGKLPFAAVNLVMPFLMILGGVGFMIGTGGSALTAKYLGEGEKDRANRCFTMMILLTVISGVVLSALGMIFIRPILSLLGAGGEMADYCVTYGRVIMAFNTAFMLQNVFQTFFTTAEKPHLGLFFTLAAGFTNMALDALFIAVFNWGVAGAALATGISQCVGGILPVFYFCRPNGSLLKFRKTFIEGKTVLKACFNGSSELMSNISGSLVGMLYNFQLIRLAGENGVAAYGVLMYVQFIFIAVFIGYSIGTAPVISYNFGAANHTELKNILIKSLKIMLATGIAMTAASNLLSAPLAKIFVGYDASLYEMTVHAFRIFSFAFILQGINIFTSSFFTALNNGAVSAAVSFLRTLVFQSSCVMTLPLISGLDGIWWAVAAAEVFAFLISAVFLFVYRKRYRYI